MNVPRLHSITGKSLPSPRVVSNVVHDANKCDFREPKQSALMMQFGQFIDHDFVGTPTNRGKTMLYINGWCMCCSGTLYNDKIVKSVHIHLYDIVSIYMYAYHVVSTSKMPIVLVTIRGIFVNSPIIRE